MKILVLSHRFYPDVGGIEVNSEVLSEAFHQYGHEVQLVTWTKERGDKKFPFQILRNPDAFTLLKANKWADVVFENNVCLRLSWPRLFIKRPSVIALNNWINRVDGNIAWQDKLKYRWLKQCSAVIAVSNAVKNKCFDKAIVIGNPYRSDLFKVENTVKNRCSDFVFLGRLVSDKGADLAIHAFRKLIDIRQNAGKPLYDTYLTIIGEGPELAPLKKLVKDTELEDSVHFQGVLKGQYLVNCLNRHRFLLVPSIWEEPFGNVALEGMACGLIPIVSNGGGLPEAVGEAGLIFQSGDVDSLASMMESIYENVGKQSQIYKKIKTHLANHSAEVVAAKYLNVFQTAMQS
ncbi:glycosyltransferase family 4 protein [Dyadobacter sp. CY326]|uniref:glycosyltransferase family 4 protein n=1 Tax=Dyadobacter sp. CY326 TaxID=2907300 RepID=UPI001F1BDB11|nr:glycosyltransferase family 4 protein [Dyadobacter sp. CY326]MCE7066133.1 glycosyltransferase family 4 protein [Dyadobacter sp. CY326]